MFAAQSYQAGQLKLVPYSTCTSLYEEGAKLPPLRSTVQVTMPSTEKGGKDIIMVVMPRWPDQDTLTRIFTNSLIVPYWLARDTGDPDRGNMHQSTLKFMSSFTAGKEAVQNPIVIPILQNSRALAEGDELLVYSEALVKPPVSTEPNRKDVNKHAKAKPANATKR